MADRSILVAVDGGMRACRRVRRKPDLFVGDGDSERRIPTDIPTVLYPREKDFSDFAGALGEVRRRNVQVVVVAGLLGGRLDHEWANLLEAGRRSREFAGIVAPTARGMVVVTSCGCTAVTPGDPRFSLFSLNGTATITLVGARWELERRRVRPGSHGLGNVARGEIDLTVHAGTVALVFPAIRPSSPPSPARPGRRRQPGSAPTGHRRVSGSSRSHRRATAALRRSARRRSGSS